MAKNKTSRLNWKVGILPTGDIFLHFDNGVQHFECTMDGNSPLEMGKALIETHDLRKSGWKPTVDSPSVIPMKPGKPS